MTTSYYLIMYIDNTGSQVSGKNKLSNNKLGCDLVFSVRHKYHSGSTIKKISFILFYSENWRVDKEHYLQVLKM